MTIQEIELTYTEMSKEIHYINERLVLLLNELEQSFSFSPFDTENAKLLDLWNKISAARNYEIYKKD